MFVFVFINGYSNYLLAGKNLFHIAAFVIYCAINSLAVFALNIVSIGTKKNVSVRHTDILNII